MVDNIFVTIKIEELGFTIVGFTEQKDIGQDIPYEIEIKMTQINSISVSSLFLIFYQGVYPNRINKSTYALKQC